MFVLEFGWCGGSSQLTDSKTNATSSNQASARRTGYNGSETCFLRTLTMNQVNHDKAHQAPVPGAELDEFLPYQLDDSAVNCHGNHEYGELGFDSGEGA